MGKLGFKEGKWQVQGHKMSESVVAPALPQLNWGVATGRQPL